MRRTIYKEKIIAALKRLADLDYQTRIWLNTDNPNNLVDSFVELACALFDDSTIGDLLENGEIILSKAATKALQELSDAVDAVDERRPQEEIINDPLMDIVRKKAAKALELIETSDGSEDTVEIIDSK